MFDHFGFLAHSYEKFIKPKAPEQLWGLANLPSSGPFLDAGGGTGRVAQFMNGKASQVIVADPSVKMLVQARSKPEIFGVCSPSEELPFPDGYFHRVIMVDALHHVLDQTQTANELWRVLKPGGRLVIEEPDIRKVFVKLIAIAEKITLMRSHFLSPEEIVALFDKPNTRMIIVREGNIAWVIIDKR